MKYILLFSFIGLLSCSNNKDKQRVQSRKPDTLALFKEYLELFKEIKEEEFPLNIDPLNLSHKKDNVIDGRFRMFEPFEGYPSLLPPPKRYYPIAKLALGRENYHALVYAVYEMISDTTMSKDVNVDLSTFDNSGKMIENINLAQCCQKYSADPADALRDHSKVSIDEDGSIVINHNKIGLKRPNDDYDSEHNRIIKIT